MKNASTLPALINSAFANSTSKKYKASWKKWVEWTQKYPEISFCPADPFYVALYFNDIASKDNKIGTVTAAYLGIRWGHYSCGVSSPTEDKFVKLAFEGAKRILAPKTIRNQKEIITPDLLKSIVETYKTSTNLMEIRSVLVYLLAFSGFMRISELLALKLKDIKFTETGMTFFIEKSKVDQLREGSTIFISKYYTNCCPVEWLQKYLQLAHITDPESFIICRLAKCKVGHKAIGKSHVSYTTALENMRKVLPNDVDPKTIATHSLRAGGASQAANKGVSDRMISKHGRWSSKDSRDKYIKDSHKRRYGISMKLGL